VGAPIKDINLQKRDQMDRLEIWMVSRLQPGRHSCKLVRTKFRAEQQKGKLSAVTGGRVGMKK